MPDIKPSVSVVRRVAEELRQIILAHSDEDFLGSETDLVTKLKISRPTFRQAAKLVEQEQLLVIRRGVGGGFFARQPSASAVAHVAAVYLHARKATIEDAIRSAKPIFAEIARTAARRSNPQACANLAAFITKDRNLPPEFKAFLKSEREFLQIFAATSSNSVLELYALVLVDFAASFVAGSVFARHPERVATYRSLRANLIQAILNGDEQVADVLCRRRSDMIIGWMELDMQTHKPVGTMRRAKPANRQLIQSTNQVAASVTEDFTSSQ